MPDVTGGQLPTLGAVGEVAQSPEEALVSVGQVKAPDNLRTEPLLSPASGPPSLMPSSDRSLFMKTREQTEEDVAMHQVQQPPGEERIDLRHYYVTIHFILQGLHSRGWLLVTASPRPLCHRSSHSRGLSRLTMKSRCSTSSHQCRLPCQAFTHSPRLLEVPRSRARITYLTRCSFLQELSHLL